MEFIHIRDCLGGEREGNFIQTTTEGEWAWFLMRGIDGLSEILAAHGGKRDHRGM